MNYEHRTDTEHPTFTKAMELFAIEPTTPPPLQIERAKLAELEAQLERTFPEGATLAEDAVAKQRAVVEKLEQEAMG